MKDNLIKILTDKDKEKYSQREWAQMINCLSGFKSINLVGTISKNNVTNATMISSMFHIGANPPLMGFVLRPHSKTSPRHSLLNIKETGYFTVNHVNKNIFKASHQTSARYHRDVSEFEACGLEVEKNSFQAPYVKSSHIKIGLKFINSYEVKENSTQIIVGEILEFYAPKKSFYSDGHIDIESAGSLTVTGLDSYHETKIISRLNYAKTDVVPYEIKSIQTYQKNRAIT